MGEWKEESKTKRSHKHLNRMLRAGIMSGAVEPIDGSHGLSLAPWLKKYKKRGAAEKEKEARMKKSFGKKTNTPLRKQAALVCPRPNNQQGNKSVRRKVGWKIEQKKREDVCLDMNTNLHNFLRQRERMNTLLSCRREGPSRVT